MSLWPVLLALSTLVMTSCATDSKNYEGAVIMVDMNQEGVTKWMDQRAHVHYTYSINCDNCGIHDVDHDTFARPNWKQIEEIHIQNIKPPLTIHPDPFSGHPMVKDLRLIRLPITSVPINLLNGLTLKKLVISGNERLTFLSPAIFKGQSEIHTLDLSNNNLQSINEIEFTDLRAVKHIHLQDNNITLMPEKIFEGLMNIETVDLSNNPVFGVSVNDLLAFSPAIQTIAVDMWPCNTLEKMFDYVRDDANDEQIPERARKVFQLTEVQKKSNLWWITFFEGIMCFRQPELAILRQYAGDEETKERLCTRLVHDQVLNLRDRYNEANNLWAQMAKENQKLTPAKQMFSAVKQNVVECRGLSLDINSVFLV